jgi:hypothetical protein
VQIELIGAKRGQREQPRVRCPCDRTLYHSLNRVLLRSQQNDGQERDRARTGIENEEFRGQKGLGAELRMEGGRD